MNYSLGLHIILKNKLSTLRIRYEQIMEKIKEKILLKNKNVKLLNIIMIRIQKHLEEISRYFE